MSDYDVSEGESKHHERAIELIEQANALGSDLASNIYNEEYREAAQQLHELQIILSKLRRPLKCAADIRFGVHYPMLWPWQGGSWSFLVGLLVGLLVGVSIIYLYVSGK
jgi:hypothetical protein